MIYIVKPPQSKTTSSQKKHTVVHFEVKTKMLWKGFSKLQVPYFPAHKTHFCPEKCDLNLTCVLCAKGKYYFQTYKYPYIYHTTSLSWDSEICFHIMRPDITACERLTFLSGDLP